MEASDPAGNGAGAPLEAFGEDASFYRIITPRYRGRRRDNEFAGFLAGLEGRQSDELARPRSEAQLAGPLGRERGTIFWGVTGIPEPSR